VQAGFGRGTVKLLDAAEVAFYKIAMLILMTIVAQN
jgi:hypothetical protein